MDGSLLYYVPDRNGRELWEMPAGGGQGRQVIATGIFHGWWSVTKAGIYYVDLTADLPAHSTSDNAGGIFFHRLATGRSEAVGSILRLVDHSTPDFCASLDGQRIIFSQAETDGSSIMIVEGLRP